MAEWYKHEFPKRLERVLALDGARLAQTIDMFGMNLPAWDQQIGNFAFFDEPVGYPQKNVRIRVICFCCVKPK